MNNWQEKVEPGLKDHLERQIKETHTSKEAIISSKEPKLAQLWIAIANLSRQVFEINLRLKYLERALRDVSTKQQSSIVIESQEPNNEVEQAMKKVLAGKKPATNKKTKNK